MTFALVQPLALLSMLIDHLGAVGLLGDWSRLLGRFALPAFVVMLACNAMATSDPARLAWRVAVLALVSQPFYTLVLAPRLSIMVPLLLVVLLVWAYRLRCWDALALVLGFCAVLSPWYSYGLPLLLLVPVCLVPGPAAAFLALSWPLIQYPAQPVVALFALASLLLILVLVRFPFDVPRLPRLVTRWFYPAHLAVLSLS